jgi:N-terminal half of MaoC dehydratase
MDDSHITPEIKALIGTEGEPQISSEPVEHSEVRRFAQAVMDDDPIFWNATHVKNTRYSAVVAPPLFPLFAHRRPPGSSDPLAPAATDPDFDGFMGLLTTGLPPVPLPMLPRLLNGGNEVEFYQLPKLGDYITARAKYLDIYEKTGRSGPMVFIVVETRYTNQLDELLMISRLTLIRR